MSETTEEVRQELVEKLTDPTLTESEIAKIKKKLAILKDNS